MPRFIFAFSLLFLSTGAFAQSIVYYPISSVLGLSTNPKKTVWLDAKFQTNSYFSSLSTEISPEFTIKSKPKALFYMGVGTRINYLNLIENKNVFEGYFLNAGTRLMPFEKYPKIQIAFELSPFVSRKADIGIFRSQIGIGYCFSK
jgi:hypothetical protein